MAITVSNIFGPEPVNFQTALYDILRASNAAALEVVMRRLLKGMRNKSLPRKTRMDYQHGLITVCALFRRDLRSMVRGIESNAPVVSVDARVFAKNYLRKVITSTETRGELIAEAIHKTCSIPVETTMRCMHKVIVDLASNSTQTIPAKNKGRPVRSKKTPLIASNTNRVFAPENPEPSVSAAHAARIARMGSKL